MTTLRLALASLTTAALGLAQTTGVVGINDYTVSGSGSGSTSCVSQCFLTPVPLPLNVSTAPGNIVVFVWSFCPCFGGFDCGAPNACLPAIPFTACGTSTNQSFDLQFGCVLSVAGIAVANAAGDASMVLPIPALGPLPPCSFPSATQAVILDPCGLGLPNLPGPFVFSQSHDLTFW